jgi:hypothetical protein
MRRVEEEQAMAAAAEEARAAEEVAAVAREIQALADAKVHAALEAKLEEEVRSARPAPTM